MRVKVANLPRRAVRTERMFWMNYAIPEDSELSNAPNMINCLFP